jgi:hypothetical protein
MNDQPCEVPLVEQLRSVPSSARALVSAGPLVTHSIPYGRMCHEAADEIERQKDFIDKWTNEPTLDQLRARVAELEAAPLGLVAIVELRKDRELLEWVLANCKLQVQDFSTGNRDVYEIESTRAAIVAAKKDRHATAQFFRDQVAAKEGK